MGAVDDLKRKRTTQDAPAGDPMGKETGDPPAEAEEKPKGRYRITLEENVFGTATKEALIEDPEAAGHWDIRIWRRA